MISAVILTHNDEKILENTVRHLTWCGEIIVIDDKSTDNTRNIASRYTDKVFIRDLGGDFAAQRNFGLSKSKGDWVLFVDSDETVSENLSREIISAISDNKSRFISYYVNRTDFLFGKELKYGETAGIKLLRLAKKKAGFWVRPVHETWQVQGRVGKLKTPLLHYPHPDVSRFLDNVNRYSTINAGYMHAQGTKSGLWQIISFPSAKFFLNYIYRRGYMDGMPGIIMSIMMSFHSFLTRSKLYLLKDK